MKQDFFLNTSNWLLSVNVMLSITATLFIFGLFGAVWLQSQQLIRVLKENFEIQLFLQNNNSKQLNEKIRQILIHKNYILRKNDRPGIYFVSKEDALRIFTQETKEKLPQFLSENPLRDAFIIKIKPALYQNDLLLSIKDELEKLEGVYEVNYMENFISNIQRNIFTISLVLGILGCIVLGIVIFLMDATIKLALYSKRFLIRSMQLVGATDTFIQKPFLRNALIQGGVSGVFSTILLMLLLYILQTQVDELSALQSIENSLIMATLLIVLGSTIAWLSAYRAINKYLKMSLDELI